MRSAAAVRRRALVTLPLLLLLGLAPAEGQSIRRPAAPRYDVVALRVEFQPDTSRFTTGTGVFGDALFDTLQVKIDPLPHDAGYFQAHLDFLQDYVGRVSDGRTVIGGAYLIPEMVRLPQPMRAYSPIGEAWDEDPAELAKLGALVRDAWTAADAASTFDMSRVDPAHTAFVLFHAGAGRDVELIGTTLDKTPEDIPSFSFVGETLREVLAGQVVTFKGRSIDNTLLLPETESRLGFDFIARRPFVLELSINGLLAASFFNYLGVPDLFNTETGESAIGPFGLMDPLGFFAYNGLFPPEPSAWTKFYLGWADPVTPTGAGPEVLRLTAASESGGVETARIPLSGSEYFLVENRNRDPEGDGLILRVWKDGQVVEQRVQEGDQTFTRFDQAGFVGGVVVGVDNYDWALPGGFDDEDSLRNGGLLVWHVDERVLAGGIPDNRVNADPARRGLDLEEADGAQDIGFPSGNPFGPQPELGTPFDYFYAGNPIRVVTESGRELRLYENRFGPDTHPSSDANEGGPGFIVLDAISPAGREMTFVYTLAEREGIVPLAPFRAARVAGEYGEAGSVSRIAGARMLLLESGGPAGVLLGVEEETGRTVLAPDGPYTTPAVSGSGRAFALYRGQARGPELLVVEGSAATTLTLQPAEALSGMRPASAPVLIEANGTEALYAIWSGAGTSRVVRVNPADGAVEVLPDGEAAPVALASAGGGRLVVVGQTGARVVETGETWVFAPRAEGAIGQPVFGRDRDGLFGVVPVPDADVLWFLYPDGEARPVNVPVLFPAMPEDTVGLSPYPVLADLDADGALDVVFTYGNRLVALTRNGAVVDHFPVALPAPVLARPLVAELTPGGGWSVLLAALNGYLYAFDAGQENRPVPGFPLAVGNRVAATPLLADGHLYAVAGDGSLRAWRLEALQRVWWGSRYGNARNTAYVELLPDDIPAPPAAAGLFVGDETYNWPNPVREGVTRLRFQTTRDCRVRVVVTDMAGGFVEEMAVEQVRGGAPSEIEWRPTGPSGLYFARITAETAEGEAETQLVKIAIIR